MNGRQDKLINLQFTHALKRFSVHSVISVPSVAKKDYRVAAPSTIEVEQW